MKQGFMKHVASLIKQSDLVLEVLDARYPEKTRNLLVERMIKQRGKQLMLVINKSDIMPNKREMEEKKKNLAQHTNAKVVFISALHRDGINLIRKEISIASRGKQRFNIGVVGYPNTGKSTLINSLAGKGRGRLATSRKAGLTRGIARLKITDGVYLIDSPGIIPVGDDEFDLFLVEAKNPNQLKEVEDVAVKLIQLLGKEKVGKFYGLSSEEVEQNDESELLQAIAIKKRFLVKASQPNEGKAARDLLECYQRHELI